MSQIEDENNKLFEIIEELGSQVTEMNKKLRKMTEDFSLIVSTMCPESNYSAPVPKQEPNILNDTSSPHSATSLRILPSTPDKKLNCFRNDSIELSNGISSEDDDIFSENNPRGFTPVTQLPDIIDDTEYSSLPRPLIQSSVNGSRRNLSDLSDPEIVFTPNAISRINKIVNIQPENDGLSSTLDEIPVINSKRNKIDYSSIPEDLQRKVSYEDIEESLKYLKQFNTENKLSTVISEDDLDSCIASIYKKELIQILSILGVIKETSAGFTILKNNP
eukprot:GHVP01003281.1.p2 GENE.GHVP01003281.1~~GHVP01003281.1.p2  ORF type:complete len:276 (-),score=56.30 GHVP01003281.1:2459-3286(-)